MDDGQIHDSRGDRLFGSGADMSLWTCVLMCRMYCNEHGTSEGGRQNEKCRKYCLMEKEPMRFPLHLSMGPAGALVTHITSGLAPRNSRQKATCDALLCQH